MGNDKEYRRRLDAVLTQLKEDLSIVRAGKDRPQHEDYRRALHWSDDRVLRKTGRHLRATLKRQEWTLGRIEHLVGNGGWNLDASVPMPGRVSGTRMTFARWAESAYWSVWYHGQEVEELVRTAKECASHICPLQLSSGMLMILPVSMALDTLAYNDI